MIFKKIDNYLSKLNENPLKYSLYTVLLIVLFIVAKYLTGYFVEKGKVAAAPEIQPDTIGKMKLENVETERVKQYAVHIPTDVESIWVFYQSKSNQTQEGCTRPFEDPISPEVFREKIAEFISYKLANRDIELIFTAYSPERQWDAPSSEIRIDGQTLEKMAPYYCNNSRDYGYRLKVD